MKLRFVIGLMLATACTSNGGGGTPPTDAPSSACQSIAGTWTVGGTCGADLCTMTQAACAITQVQCNSGAHSTSGTISGAQFMYTGVSGGGVPATCSGTLNGGTFAGTCTISGVQCSVNGKRQ
jgi:hypothetical protein